MVGSGLPCARLAAHESDLLEAVWFSPGVLPAVAGPSGEETTQYRGVDQHSVYGPFRALSQPFELQEQESCWVEEGSC